ncbi:MAG: NFYB/HAP3 family transcription factor subunit [Candidatus Lokiarchaeota archaeon]|nr:NFYB/HAP3 family transcription factor subunit [Candidatus Lokiarchaeota archaeon]
MAFAWSPLRSLMKKAGAEIVSRNAVDRLMDYLEERAKSLTACAIDISKHSGRKKITKNDMKIAIEML